MCAQTFFFLQHEGLLFRGCIATGLTALRNAYRDESGFYTGAFQLSIGLERLMKVVLVLHHMLEHQLQPPTGSQIRRYSHDLVTLYSEVKDIARAHSVRTVNDLNLDPVEDQIFQLLSEFAQRTRYANLDALGGQPACVDPLGQWDQILRRILESEVKPRAIEVISRQASEIAASIAPSTFVLVHDLNNKPMSAYEVLAIPRLQEVALRHAVRHVLRVLGALNAVLKDVCDAVQHQGMQISDSPVVPFMGEFLQDFVNLDKHSMLHKKRWP